MPFVFFLIAVIVFFLAAADATIFKSVSPVPLGLGFLALGLLCGGGLPSNWFARRNAQGQVVP